MNKKILFGAIRVVVSFGLIALLVWVMRDNLGTIGSAIKNTDKLFLIMCFLITTVAFCIMGVRLRTIIEAQRLNLKIIDGIYLTFIGFFFNNFLPTVVGGDMVKAYYVSKRTHKKLASFACVAVDRFIGSSTLILLALIAFLFVEKPMIDTPILVFFAIAVITVGFSVLLLFSKRIIKRIPWINGILNKLNLFEKAKAIYIIIYNYKKHPALLFNALFLSTIIQGLSFIGVWFLVRSLGFNMSLAPVFLFMPLIGIAGMAPSINGLGVREGLFVLLFGSALGKEGAFALSILYLGVYISLSLIGGVIYALGGHDRIRLAEIKEE